jgi:CBS-domain-containing membrane protein
MLLTWHMPCAGGHLIGALLGCASRAIFPAHLAWLSAALGMSLSLVAMMAAGLTHPPGEVLRWAALMRGYRNWQKQVTHTRQL